MGPLQLTRYHYTTYIYIYSIRRFIDTAIYTITAHTIYVCLSVCM